MLCDIVPSFIRNEQFLLAFNKLNFCEYAWKNSPLLKFTTENYILSVDTSINKKYEVIQPSFVRKTF